MLTKPQLQPSIFISLPLSLIPLLFSGYVFSNCIVYKDTEDHWRYTCSLIGFAIFALMFLCVIAAALFQIRQLRKNTKA